MGPRGQVGGDGGVVNEVVPDYRGANELTIVGHSTEDQVRWREEKRMESQNGIRSNHRLRVTFWVLLL